MKRNNRYFRWGWIAWAVLLLMVSACTMYLDSPQKGVISGDNFGEEAEEAIGTIRSWEGIRYIRLDASNVVMIVNPERVDYIPDGTRVYVYYDRVVTTATMPDFCTDTVLVRWIITLDMGEVSHDRLDRLGDPLMVFKNWMTTFEDGFLTVSYAAPQDGETSHNFCLCPGEKENEFRLIHDANGDLDGKPYTGLVCFYVASMLPDTKGKTVTLSLTYLELDNTIKTLTFDYRSPQ